MVKVFPKDEGFFTLFEKQAEKLGEAARLLDEIINNPSDLEKYSLELKKLEEEADTLGHNVVDRLRKTFITPLETEDIDLLRQKLDDIMDFTEKAVNRMVIYKIPIPFPKAFNEYFQVIEDAIKEIKEGVNEIRNVGKFHEQLHWRCRKLNELEDKGDIVNRNALKRLFDTTNTNPDQVLEIIKLKEIYETFEEAIDRCEDVGNIFESIMIKNR